MIAILAADVLQQNDLIPREIDGFQADLLVAEIVHLQAELAPKRLQDLENPAVKTDKSDSRTSSAGAGVERCRGFRRKKRSEPNAKRHHDQNL